MKVYVVIEEDRGCGPTVVGVYLRQEDAEKVVDHHSWIEEEEVVGA